MKNRFPEVIRIVIVAVVKTADRFRTTNYHLKVCKIVKRMETYSIVRNLLRWMHTYYGIDPIKFSFFLENIKNRNRREQLNNSDRKHVQNERNAWQSVKIRATKFQAAINFKVFPGVFQGINFKSVCCRLHEARM